MSEHLTFKQSLRNSSQIDLDKRLVPARTVQVYRLGNQFFPSTTFSRHQYRSTCPGYPLHRRQHRFQSLALPNDMTAVKIFCFCDRDTGSFLLFRQFQRRFNTLHQRRIVPRFGNEIKGSSPHSLYCQRDTSPGRHQNDRYIRTKQFDLLQQKQPLRPVGRETEIHVHQYQLRGNGTYSFHRLFRPRYRLYFIFRPFEHKTERRTNGTIIIYY